MSHQKEYLEKKTRKSLLKSILNNASFLHTIVYRVLYVFEPYCRILYTFIRFIRFQHFRNSSFINLIKFSPFKETIIKYKKEEKSHLW